MWLNLFKKKEKKKALHTNLKQEGKSHEEFMNIIGMFLQESKRKMYEHDKQMD